MFLNPASGITLLVIKWLRYFRRSQNITFKNLFEIENNNIFVVSLWKPCTEFCHLTSLLDFHDYILKPCNIDLIYIFFSGATNVGTVKVYFDKTLQTNNNKSKFSSKEQCFGNSVQLKKGQLIGEFRMGSTLVLIFEAPTDFRFTVLPGEKVKMGQRLGCVQSHKFVDRINEERSSLKSISWFNSTVTIVLLYCDIFIINIVLHKFSFIQTSFLRYIIIYICKHKSFKKNNFKVYSLVGITSNYLTSNHKNF